MRKKWIALSLSLLLAAQGTAAFAEASRLLGDIWGANPQKAGASLFGYYLLSEDGLGGNPDAIESLTMESALDGSTTYVIHLKKDLAYSDGSPIRAADYVFAALLGVSPALDGLDLSAKSAPGRYAGAAEYREGKPFAGVRLLSEYQFSLTLPADRPDPEDLGPINLIPYPVQAVAPGREVRDDGQGAYLSKALTADLLQETLLNPETGYLINPSVASGDFRVAAFDAATGQIRLEPNPYHKRELAALTEFGDPPVPLSSGGEDGGTPPEAPPPAPDRPAATAVAVEPQTEPAEHTTEPTAHPTATPVPIYTSEPVSTPLPTEATEVDEATATPTDEPTLSPEPTAQPSAQSISILPQVKKIGEGKYVLILTAELNGFEGQAPTLQWQCDDGDGWKDLEGATGLEFQVDVTPENMNYQWRARAIMPE